ncbi:uncharacterized protein LOC112348594 [Selaginella moellendorffii]|uniref:uncharacterized protein LOC112348594 n=1 Tax=Selaginella moellendorffii TaxID=88036 RepID=UPI000D1CD8AE|nr:uncharacterized protein LOC112348594 [Selaginella moellendorffii]|eukprot:XP_024537192.1 uncharacterized protein LOC112348594 [Selaginella moellendorffii]
MATMATMKGAFGSMKEIGDIVANFDFSKIDVRSKSAEDYLHTNLAPSFGALNAETVKKMDEVLKVCISGTTTLLAKVPPEERTWEKVNSMFMQNPLVEPMGDGISRADKFLNKSSSDFKIDGSPDAAIVKVVQTWFVNLIADEDVLKSTKIDIEVLGRIVAQSGATITSFENFFAKHEHHEKTIIDIGVLRYPDMQNPYFKVYRIKLFAWSDSNRILFHQEDSNGIIGEFTFRKFKPRKEVIDKMNPDAKRKAVEAADNIFGF